MTFNIGEVVAWASQAGGKKKTKQGRILTIIKAGINPADMGLKGPEIMFDGGVRKQDSYLVEVDRGKRKPALYWPLASQLKPALSTNGDLPGMEGTRTPLSVVCERWRAQKDRIKTENTVLDCLERDIIGELKRINKLAVKVEHDGQVYEFRRVAKGEKLTVHKTK